MKKQLLTIMLIFACIVVSKAQPSTFNYQSVIRDIDGNVLQNQEIDLKLIITDIAKTDYYIETHVLTTNNLGQISAQVGGGNIESGDFSTIPWGSTQLYLVVQVSLDQGVTFTDMGRSPLLAVPYALYAASGNEGPPGEEGNGIESVTDNANGSFTLNFTDGSTYTTPDLTGATGNGIESVTNNGNGTLTFNFTDGSNYTTPNLAGPTIETSPGNILYNDTTGWKATSAIKIVEQKVGIGSDPAISRLLVKGDSLAGENDPIFEVKNKDGAVVFAVYDNGVEIYVDDTGKKKGVKGGFAVGGLSGGKANGTEYLRVTPDSVRIYLREDTVKGGKGGFAVGGLSGGKASPYELLKITPDSTRFYVKQGAKGVKGGFAVGGLSGGKNITNEFLHVSPDSVRIYIDESTNKGVKGGFAVGGLSGGKANGNQYLNVEFDTTQTIKQSEPRILFYPVKNAFLVGQVIIESSDSVGINSTATGYESKAIGAYSQAFGFKARAFGNNSTAIGNESNAEGNESYALGNYAKTFKKGSYAIGSGAQAIGLRSFAFGSTGIDSAGVATSGTKAAGDYSFAFGVGSYSGGQGSVALGTQDTAMGNYSVALGYRTNAEGWYSTAMGYGTTASNSGTAIGNRTTAIGSASTSGGYKSIASGSYSVALGWGSEATNSAAFAMGYYCTASGMRSVALGSETQATSIGATALGINTLASGSYSLATGSLTTASNFTSTALGFNTISSGQTSTAIGRYSEASGTASLATGGYTTATGSYTTSMGYNIDVSGSYSFGIGLNSSSKPEITQSSTLAILGGLVGIGTAEPDKPLHVEGDARVTGDIYYGGGSTIYSKPDYVFTDSYDKKFKIDEIEKFINHNNHLPWITPANEEKDGINITRMSIETLEAVENMQLQIIQLKNELDEAMQIIEKQNLIIEEIKNDKTK
jgi:hypothetical protein